MIRVRYKDLSPGLHGKAERSGRGTTVYLLPGLTVGQRKAALRRLRQEASRGFGPELRRPDLAVALAADRFRIGVRHTAAVVRLHPAGSLLPTALAAALMALFVLAPISFRMVSFPQSAPPSGLLPASAPTVVRPPVLAHGNQPAAHGSGEHLSACSLAGGRAGDVANAEDQGLRVEWRCWSSRVSKHAAGRSRWRRAVLPDRRAVVYGAVIPAGSG
jgi:hypothetical protein